MRMNKRRNLVKSWKRKLYLFFIINESFLSFLEKNFTYSVFSTETKVSKLLKVKMCFY